MSLFDADGNHGRDLSVSPPLLDVVDLLPDGKIVARDRGGLRSTATGSTGIVRSDDEWGVLAPDGTPHSSLGEFLGTEWWATFNSDGTIAGGRPHPYSRGTMGRRVGRPGRDRHLRSLRDQGIRSGRHAGHDRAPDVELGPSFRAVLDDYYARRYADLPDEERTEALDQVRGMPLVDSYPAFAGIMSDRAGYLWGAGVLGAGSGGPGVERVRSGRTGSGTGRNAAGPPPVRDWGGLPAGLEVRRAGRGARGGVGAVADAAVTVWRYRERSGAVAGSPR